MPQENAFSWCWTCRTRHGEAVAAAWEKQAWMQDSSSGSEAGDREGEVMETAAWGKLDKVWKLLL